MAVTKFVDDTLANGTKEDQTNMKQKLLSARESGPGNIVEVSTEEAEKATNVQAAGVLMDPLSFYQVRAICQAYGQNTGF